MFCEATLMATAGRTNMKGDRGRREGNCGARGVGRVGPLFANISLGKPRVINSCVSRALEPQRHFYCQITSHRKTGAR